MPIYDYHCSSCDQIWESIYKIDDRSKPELQPCPNCNSENTVKLKITSISIGDPLLLGRMKPSSAFTERIKQIKQRYPDNSISI